VKDQLKRVIPPDALRAFRKAKRSAQFVRLAWSDYRQFSRNHSRDVDSGGGRNLQAHLIFHAHALEKGLSHANMRLKFGSTAIRSLLSVMEAYSGRGCSKEAEAYQMALSVLNRYRLLHESQGFNNTPLSAAPEWLLSEIRSCSFDVGGVDRVHRTDLFSVSAEGFKTVAFGRRSVREFHSDPVPADKIREAVRVASRAPSVCNRQSVRVRVIRRPDLIEEVLTIQNGLSGYEPPPVLLAVTADARDYVAATERNQPYIDGGLFSMSLLLGLEVENLAACSLNVMFSIAQERQLRSALELDVAELPIMLIAVGGFQQSYLVPKSFRYEPEDLTL
jgi:nitroreductase